MIDCVHQFDCLIIFNVKLLLLLLFKHFIVYIVYIV